MMGMPKSGHKTGCNDSFFSSEIEGATVELPGAFKSDMVITEVNRSSAENTPLHGSPIK